MRPNHNVIPKDASARSRFASKDRRKWGLSLTEPKRGNGWFQSLFQKETIFLLAAALACSIFAPRPASTQELLNVTSAGDVSWPTSRHVFYDPGLGRVYVFYSQPYGIAYRNYNFISWSNESVAISTGAALSLDPAGATNTNTMYSSLYYDQASSSVYVIASDPNVLLETNNPYNSVFLIKGTINADGSIGPWSIAQRSISGTIGSGGGHGTGECAPGMSVSITYMKGAANPISWSCDAQAINGTGCGNPSNGTDNLGQYGLTASLSGGTVYSPSVNDGNKCQNTAPASKNYGEIVPVNDTVGGKTYDFELVQKHPAFDNFALQALSYEYSGAYNTRELNNTGATGTQPLATHSMAPQPDDVSSLIAMGYIDSTGELGYKERTAYNTWSAETVVDACAGSITTPCGNPSAVYVQGAPTIDMAYTIYLSSYGAVNYSSGSIDSGATFPFTVTPNWQSSANGDSVPQVPAYVNYGDPIPVVWDNSSGGVDFEFIPTDNAAPPTITAISSSPATAPFSVNAYDLVITGTGFLQYSAARSVQTAILLGGSAQTGITVTSTTFVSATQIRASIVINSNGGSPYDILVTNPDGRTALDSGALALPLPVVSSVVEDSTNHHLTSPKYDLVIGGSGFEDWTSPGPASVTLLKGGLPQTEISVTSTTYSSQTQLRASIVLKPPISGGPYDVKVTNSDGQTTTLSAAYSISSPTLSGISIAGEALPSGGIEPVIPDCSGGSCPPTPSGRPTRQLVVSGSNFEDWTSPIASVTIAGVYVDSVTYLSPTQFTANINVTTAAALGHEASVI